MNSGFVISFNKACRNLSPGVSGFIINFLAVSNPDFNSDIFENASVLLIKVPLKAPLKALSTLDSASDFALFTVLLMALSTLDSASDFALFTVLLKALSASDFALFKASTKLDIPPFMYRLVFIFLLHNRFLLIVIIGLHIFQS